MAEKKITITIDEDGSIRAKTEGLKGKACLAALEELLGNDLAIVSIKTTDEFEQEAQIDRSQSIKRNKL